MKQLFITSLLSLALTQTFGQTDRIVSAYLQGQYNNTLYDRTEGNNPWAIGLGLQVFLNNSSQFKPTVDFTTDIYLMDDKVNRLYPDGTSIESVDKMVNLFGGVSYHPVEAVYISFVAGPSFISEHQTLWGIKPSVGVYLSPTKRWTAKLSYINILNRTERTQEDFGSLSISLGLRLY